MVVCHCEAASIDFEGGAAEAISSVHERLLCRSFLAPCNDDNWICTLIGAETHITAYAEVQSSKFKINSKIKRKA